MPPQDRSTSGRLFARLKAWFWARREGLSTVLMGAAAVITAWCAFEAAKWGGVQSLHFAQAAAARTESSRHDLLDHAFAQIDVATFLAWIEALRMERGGDPTALAPTYRPDPGTASGFLYERMRPELRPALEDWLASRPLRNAAAAPTPFATETYRRVLGDRAAPLKAKAEEHARLGAEAIRSANNYMLVTVFSAMTIFFAGLASKLSLRSNGLSLMLLACASFTICVVALLRLPVKVF